MFRREVREKGELLSLEKKGAELTNYELFFFFAKWIYIDKKEKNIQRNQEACHKNFL